MTCDPPVRTKSLSVVRPGPTLSAAAQAAVDGAAATGVAAAWPRGLGAAPASADASPRAPQPAGRAPGLARRSLPTSGGAGRRTLSLTVANVPATATERAEP